MEVAGREVRSPSDGCGSYHKKGPANRRTSCVTFSPHASALQPPLREGAQVPVAARAICGSSFSLQDFSAGPPPSASLLWSQYTPRLFTVLRTAACRPASQCSCLRRAVALRGVTILPGAGHSHYRDGLGARVPFGSGAALPNHLPWAT